MSGRWVNRALATALWLLGCTLAIGAGSANLYIEPTDEAVRNAADAVDRGLIGCVLMMLAWLLRWSRLRSAARLLPALLPAAGLVLFLREPGSRGAPFVWLLLTLFPTVAIACTSLLLPRRRQGTSGD